MNNKYKKLFKNVGLLTIGNFASKLLTFLLIPVYTNILSTSEYGVADLIFTTVSLLYPVFSVLMSEAIMRFALDNKDNNQVFSCAFYITTCGTVIFLCLSPIFLLFNSLKAYYIFFILYYIFDVFNLIFLQFVKGINKVKNYVIAGIISTVVTISLNIILLVIVKIGLVGYLISYIGGQVSSIVFLVISCKIWKYLLPYKKTDKKVLKNMMNFSIPMIPNSISWWISNSSDKYMLSYFTTLSITGIYSVSYKIPSIITIFSNIFMGAWQISAVDNFGSEESKQFYSKIFKNYFSFLAIIISVLIIALKIIARFLFAKDFYVAWECSGILLIATMFNGLAAFLGSIYTSAKKTKFLFHSTLIAAISNIIMNLILIPFIGGIGAAIATLISYFLVWLLRSVNSKKILNINYDYKIIIFSTLILLTQVFLQIYSVYHYFVINCILFIVLLLINKDIFISILKKMRIIRA